MPTSNGRKVREGFAGYYQTTSKKTSGRVEHGRKSLFGTRGRRNAPISSCRPGAHAHGAWLMENNRAVRRRITIPRQGPDATGAWPRGEVIGFSGWRRMARRSLLLFCPVLGPRASTCQGRGSFRSWRDMAGPVGSNLHDHFNCYLRLAVGSKPNHLETILENSLLAQGYGRRFAMGLFPVPAPMARQWHTLWGCSRERNARLETAPTLTDQPAGMEA